MTLRTPLALAALAAGFTLSGCDVVDNVNPRQSVTPEQALETVEGFEALLASAYDDLQDQTYYGQEFMLVPDALADNLRVPNETSNRYPDFSVNTIGAGLTRWGGHYFSINEVNVVLSQIDDLEVEAANPQAIRDRIKGEAYFLRALNYFDLVRAKGYEPGREVSGFDLGVIIRTEPTETVEDADFRARSTNREVYDLVVSDLQQAIDLLDGTSRGSKNFASVAASQALLARTQLYQGNYAAAEAAATEALARTSATLVDAGVDSAPLVAAFTGATNPESIFEVILTPSTDGNVTGVNASLQSLTDPTRRGFFDAVPTDDLVAAHEDGDARLALYGQATVAGEVLPFIRKYVGAVAQDVDPVPVFRVSEMLLIQAEARAEQGNTAGALAALNTLRNARGLDNFGDGDGDDASAGGVINAVLAERRVELAFEGHRFFDLKRRGLDIPKPQLGTVIPYSNFRVLARIPEGEVDNNPQLVQNPGYAD